jgi:exodeoxyribonuclease X
MLGYPYTLDDAKAAPHSVVEAYAAHNAEFDRRFIGRDWTGRSPWICTMKCAIRAWPDLPAFGNQVIRYAKNIELADKGKAEPPHAAAADAYVTAHILAALLRLHPAETLIEWSEMPTAWPRILFGKHKGQEWSEVPHGYLEWMLNKAPESEDDGWDAWQACAQAELQRRRGNRVTSRAR